MNPTGGTDDFQSLVAIARAANRQPADPELRERLGAQRLDPDAWKVDSPDTMDLQHLGDACRRIKRYDEAARWFGRAADTAILPGDLPFRVGLLQKASACCASLGRDDDARAWLEQAVAVAEAGDAAGVDRNLFGNSLRILGDQHWKMGDAERTRDCYERAVLAHGTELTADAATSIFTMACLHHRDGRHQEAIEWFDRVINIRRYVIGGAVDNEAVGQCLHFSAQCAARLGLIEDAVERIKQAVAAKQQGDALGRVDHESLGMSFNFWGDLCANRRDHEEAIACYTQAVAAKEQGNLSAKVDHASIGLSLHMAGLAYVKLGRHEEAIGLFDRAVEAEERGDPSGRVDVPLRAQTLFHCGRCRALTSRFVEAIAWLGFAAAAVAQGDSAGKVDHDQIGTCWQLIGDCHRGLGDLALAIEAYPHAITHRERGDKQGTVYRESVGESLDSLGDCLIKTVQFEAALPWLLRASEAYEQCVKEGSVTAQQLADTRARVVMCYAALDRPAEAQAFLERAALTQTPT